MINFIKDFLKMFWYSIVGDCQSVKNPLGYSEITKNSTE